jgi:hypothetical protein
MTFTEIAAELTRGTGREVRYHAETVDEARASRQQYGAPDWEVAGWISSYTSVAAGEMERVSDDVRLLTGHPAQSLSEYLAQQP